MRATLHVHHANFKLLTPKLDGSCVDAPVIKIIPPAKLDRAIVACALPFAVSCTDNPACAATPTPLPTGFTKICIHREGDYGCPIDYPDRALIYKTVTDSRACECTTKLLGACSTNFEVFSDADCNDAVPGGGKFESNCYPSSIAPAQTVNSFRLPDPNPAGLSCAATSSAVGALKQADPITVCCR